jgi:chorismate mutase
MTQAATGPGAGAAHETLADLRIEIDRIDASMHALLMERGEIIDRLIAIKARQGGGSAFRPGREAEMMRRLVGRHHGLLPLDTVEGIWRIIISTFTYVQANYAVHADIAAGDAEMRDCCRFHFGFTVPYRVHQGAAGVIDAVARSTGDLGLVRVEAGANAGAWWMRLADSAAPKIIARLPFVERPDHPAGMPLFVVAQPLADAAAREVVLYAITLERWCEALPAALAGIDTTILGNAADGFGLSIMVAAPGTCDRTRLHAKLVDIGLPAARIAEIGSHATRFEFTQTSSRHAEVVQ